MYRLCYLTPGALTILTGLAPRQANITALDIRFATVETAVAAARLLGLTEAMVWWVDHHAYQDQTGRRLPRLPDRELPHRSAGLVALLTAGETQPGRPLWRYYAYQQTFRQFRPETVEFGAGANRWRLRVEMDEVDYEPSSSAKPAIRVLEFQLGTGGDWLKRGSFSFGDYVASNGNLLHALLERNNPGLVEAWRAAERGLLLERLAGIAHGAELKLRAIAAVQPLEEPVSIPVTPTRPVGAYSLALCDEEQYPYGNGSLPHFGLNGGDHDDPAVLEQLAELVGSASWMIAASGPRQNPRRQSWLKVAPKVAAYAAQWQDQPGTQAWRMAQLDRLLTTTPPVRLEFGPAGDRWTVTAELSRRNYTNPSGYYHLTIGFSAASGKSIELPVELNSRYISRDRRRLRQQFETDYSYCGLVAAYQAAPWPGAKGRLLDAVLALQDQLMEPLLAKIAAANAVEQPREPKPELTEHPGYPWLVASFATRLTAALEAFACAPPLAGHAAGCDGKGELAKRLLNALGAQPEWHSPDPRQQKLYPSQLPQELAEPGARCDCRLLAAARNRADSLAAKT